MCWSPGPKAGIKWLWCLLKALQDAPVPVDKWTCLGYMCHPQEAVLQCLTSQCLAWLAHVLFPFTLPKAVCRQWNGLAEPAKLNTAGIIPGTESLEQADGHLCTPVALCPNWCSALRHGAGERALNASEKLPAVGQSVRGRCSSSGVLPGCLYTAARPGPEFQVLMLPLQTSHCNASACSVLWLVVKLGD